MKKQLILGFTLLLFTLSLVLTGPATAIEPGASEQEIEVTGMVEQKGDTFVLQADDGQQYMVTGQDLSDMVGKKVRATGEIFKEEDQNRLNVKEVTEVYEEGVEFESGEETPIE